MKVSSLFNLMNDASDFLDFFDGVDTPEQMVSRLERLKRQGADDLLACIESLRSAVTNTLDDTLELSPSLEDPEDQEDDTELYSDLAGLADEENPNLAGDDSDENPKNGVSSAE
jgi:hypothetical protein